MQNGNERSVRVRVFGMVMALVVALTSIGVPGVENAEASTSIVDIITDAAGTDGGIRMKSKDYVIDRLALNAGDVVSTAAGWNDSKGTMVAVVKAKSKKKAKKVLKKMNKYISLCKEDGSLYGLPAGASAYLNASVTGRVKKYAIMVMVSTSKSSNKKGYNAAKSKL